MRIMNNKINNQKGFNLIEVMVSLVIFSIGLLGLAGLQQVGLTQNSTAMQRTLAMSQAYDILDRMRNNKAIDYTSASASNSPNCITSACPAEADLANFDLYEWEQSLAQALPNGKGFITGDPTGYIVYVGWDEGRNGSTPTSCDPPTPTDVKCIAIQGRP